MAQRKKIRSMSIRRNVPILVVLVAAFGLVLACSSAPPRITGLYSTLAVVDNRTLQAKYEQLSVFVQAEDENGFSDLAHLYIINDRADLYWALGPDSWERRGPQGQEWVGSNDIVMPDGSALPRGEYRVVLVDISGARDERTFVLDHGPTKPGAVVFPTLKLQSDRITVAGPYANDTVSVIDPTGRDPTGQFSSRREVSPGTFTLPEILGRAPEPGRRLDLYVHTYDEAAGLVLISGPYVY
jgi:hypothetical protein